MVVMLVMFVWVLVSGSFSGGCGDGGLFVLVMVDLLVVLVVVFLVLLVVWYWC